MDARYVCRLHVRTLPIKLGLVALVLVLLHIAAMTLWHEDILESHGLKPEWWQLSIFDLDTEEGFGTWFSAVLLLLVGQVLLLQWRRVRRAGDRWAPWWLILALGFHFLSLDEVVALHEYLNESLGGTPWTAVGAPVAALVGLSFIPWLWKQPPAFQLAAMVGGALYLGGAVAIEHASDWYVLHDKLNTTEYHLWIAMEEGLEMAGPIVFLRGLLALMAGDPEGAVEVAVEPHQGAA